MKKYVPSFIIALIFSAFALSFFSCGNKDHAGENEVFINGRFIHSRANMLFFDIVHVNDIERLDSVTISEDGTFKMKIKTDKPLFLKIYTNEKNFLTIIAEPEQNIYLSGDINHLDKTYTVSGSPASELIENYLKTTQKNYERLDTLGIIWENNKYAENKMELKDSLDSISKNIFISQKDFATNLINKNPESLGSLFLLYQFFGRSPVIDPFENIDLYENLSNKLSAKYPDFEHVVHLKTKVNKVKISIKEAEEIKLRLDTGKIAPDFSLPDLNDNQFKLSEHRGYTILLHFWASWSNQSIKQLSALRYYKSNYAKKGLKIVSISLDYDKEMWETAINKEKMDWINICELKYTSSQIAKLYNITQVPFFYLINYKGEIINKSSSIDVVGNDIYRLFKEIEKKEKKKEENGEE